MARSMFRTADFLIPHRDADKEKEKRGRSRANALHPRSRMGEYSRCVPYRNASIPDTGLTR